MPFATRPYATRPSSAWRRFFLTRHASFGALSLTGAVATTLLALTTSLAFGQAEAQAKTKDAKQKAEMLYARTPMSFEPNRGQVSSPEVQYLAHGARYGVALTAREAMLSLDAGAVPGQESMRRFDQIGLALAGGNSHAVVTAEDKLDGRVNYLLGNNPAKWHTDLPTYGKVRYAGVYPGVDLVYYGNQGRLEYDFVVAPHAESGAIGLHFDGAEGLKLDAQGNLTIQAANGAIVLEKPTVYQEKDGRREPVEGSFRLEANNTAGFRIGSYDHSRALVIDPVLTYSTYLGGSTNETIASAVVDANGALYVTGTTYSSDFPTTPGVFQPTAGHASAGLAFVTKFNPVGSAVVYSSFIGGTNGVGTSRGNGSVVDPSGSIYVAGTTTATDFPVGAPGVGGQGIITTNPEGSTGNSTGFVLRLNLPGNGYLYSTYLGGRGGAGVGDSVNGIAIDGTGNAVVVGSTNSANFPTTTGAYQKTSPNPNLGTSTATSTGFVASVNPGGTALNYATYLGGSGKASLSAVALDSTGNAYVVGNTSLPVNGTNYPVTTGAYQTTNSSTGAGVSGVVTKLNSTGSAIVYSTFLGANGTTPTSVALDSSSNAYIGGYDLTGGFPATSGAYQTTWASGSGFVASLKAAGNGLNFGTFLSGAVFGLGVDSNGVIDVTGSTTNPAFPMSPDSLQLTFPATAGYYPATAAFLVRLAAGGASANYSSFFSGSSYTAASGLAIDSSNNIYIAGQTCDADLPITASPAQGTKFSPACSATGGMSGFAAKFTFATPPISTNTVFTGPLGQVQSGTATTLTATTAPSTAPGNVNFVENGKVFGSAPLVNGTAYLNNQTFAVGTHTITAVYTGDTVYAESTSAPVSFTVVSALTVNFSPNSLTFGTFPIGQASGTMNAQIINSGTTPVTLYSLGMFGDYSEQDNCPVSVINGLAAGASCGVQITFTPSGTGTRIGSASLISSISSVPQTLSLTGTGTAITASLSATSAAFATTTVGTTTAPIPVTLTNSTTTGTLFISSIAATGDFAQTNNCGGALAAGASCIINITFTPTVTGARTGAIVLTDNSSTGTTQTIGLSGAGVYTLTVSPTSLTYGSQLLTTTSTAQTITLTNPGVAPVSISSVAVTGDFAQTNTCGTSVPGKSSCTIAVTFTPTVSGARTGTVTIVDGASGSPHTVALTGTGISPIGSISPGSLTFASQALTTTSVPQIVTLSNSGTAPLNVSSIAISGSSTFAQTNTCGTSVAAGSSCAISVTFTPTATGPFTGTLTVTDSATGSPRIVSLSGTGVTPVTTVTFSPASLTYTTQNTGTTSAAQAVTLTNTGSATLIISSLATSGDFAQTNTCGTSLAAGAHCTISVTFSPTAGGTRTGLLTIGDNATGTPQIISLTGTGFLIAPAVSLSPTLLTFASQNVGSTATAQSVTLSNTGNGALTLTSVVASGDFAQTNNCGKSIAAGASCTIAVTFTPTTGGARTGAITVTDNATGSPQTVALNGTGAPLTPVASFSATSLTFGSQQIGTQSTLRSFSLTNTGAANLTIASIVASGDFAQVNSCTTGLVVPGATCTISVSFAPTAAGNRTGAITITDNATGSPQTITLTGTGVAPILSVSFSPPALTFATTTTGTTTALQYTTMTNTGITALSISAITASGDFAQTNTCGTSLAPNGNCRIAVSFTPTSTGTRAGLITVIDNAPTSPQVVALTGVGEGISLTSPATTNGLTLAASGATTTTTLQLGANSFTGLVYVTCSVAFTGTGTPGTLPSCSLNPPSQTITAGATPQSIVLTVSTASPSAKNNFPWTPAGASLATLLLIGWVSPKRRRGIRLLTLLLAVVLGGLAGCAGGGTSGTTVGGGGISAGTYAVRVTAANGGTAASLTIPVKVQ